MARYRAGIVLALPEFDTYGCLEKYARNPSSRTAKLAFARLYKRAEAALLYDAMSRTRSIRAARALIGLRTGISLAELASNMLPYTDDEEEGERPASMDLTGLSDNDWVNIYKDLCAAYGDPVDLSDSIEQIQESVNDTQ